MHELLTHCSSWPRRCSCCMELREVLEVPILAIAGTQLQVTGGGCDLDCVHGSETCLTADPCNSSNTGQACQKCTDEYQEEICKPQGKWGFPCNYNDPHVCSPTFHGACTTRPIGSYCQNGQGSPPEVGQPCSGEALSDCRDY